MTDRTTPRHVDFSGHAAGHDQYADELRAALARGAACPEYLNGPAVAELERQIAAMTGRAHAAAVGSATDGLYISLRAAGVGPGDEVIVPGFSFIATVSPVYLLGATPVYVDIDPDSFHIDVDAVAAARTHRTRGVIAADLFGRCLPAAPLEQFAADYELFLYEDASQALGSAHGDRKAGSTGRASVVSFDPAKVLGGVTAGGMVLTDDADLYNTVTMLRSHGRNPTTGTFDLLGVNSRMPTTNAEVLLTRLRHFQHWQSARAGVAQWYRDELADIPGVVVAQAAETSSTDNHHKAVIRAPRRDNLRRYLTTRHVETRIHYATALPDHAAFASRPRRTVGTLPNSRQAAQEVVSLPIHPWMDDGAVEQVTTAVRDFYLP